MELPFLRVSRLLKPLPGSITGDEGMPGWQMKPLVSIAFERESARMGETGLQNQFGIYCVKGKKIAKATTTTKKAQHHERNKL